MTIGKGKAEVIDLKGLLGQDEDFVRAAVEALVQAALEDSFLTREAWHVRHRDCVNSIDTHQMTGGAGGSQQPVGGHLFVRRSQVGGPTAWKACL
jgi:hypothetical protein